MIFLTVGSALPFDRLVKAVDDAICNMEIKPEIFGQIGQGEYKPKNFPYVETFDKADFDEYFNKAEAIISHAGMGTINIALQQKKPILVIPRLKEYGELVNDHQLATAEKFEELGHVIAAYDLKDIIPQLKKLETFEPVPRENQASDVAVRIGTFLEGLIA